MAFIQTHILFILREFGFSDFYHFYLTGKDLDVDEHRRKSIQILGHNQK
jgi:hypothetical protein